MDKQAILTAGDTVRIPGVSSEWNATGRVQSIYNVGGIPTAWVLWNTPGEPHVEIYDVADLELA